MRISLAVLLLLLGCSFARAEETRPNVVLIVIDDLGRNDLGCYGSTYFKTPNIDALAGEGARLTQAYAACPVCSPTRAAIMTGKYPARLHLTDWLPGRDDRPDQRLARPMIRQALPLEEVTLAERFKEAGYATAHIGKWHLGGEGFGPREQGFDLNVAGDHTGTPRSYFAPFTGMPGLEKAEDGEYLTDRLTTEAEAFIEAKKDQPFFLYLPHYAVHIPLKAKQAILKKYPGEPKHGQQSHPTYAAMIESMDDSVRRIVEKLDELKLRERTIVVFTSDNGGLATLEGAPFAPTINSPLREGKGYLYEGGIRGPLIVSWPSKIARQVNDTITSSIDLTPTLLELCGIKAAEKIDGVSIAPALRDKKTLERDAIYWHYPHYANQGSKPGGAVREGDYKLIEFYETGRRELFNVATDQGEGRNLAAEKPELVARLAEKLAAWKKDASAQEMKPYPAYVPHPQDKGGVVTLPASKADVTGTQLRFEPLPHKNTLGYWVDVNDKARWEFTITTPGKFKVEVLQGCGKGHGGSEVNVVVADQVVRFTVEDTGHFQNFLRRPIGEVTIDKTGRYSLSVEPQKKPGGAVMDLRAVMLTPVE
jgi:arylsulfatase A